MTTIQCEHCKTDISSCPHCGEEFEEHLALPLFIVLVSLIVATMTIYQWRDSLDGHEEAMRLRKIYLKSNPDARKLPPLIH